MFVLVEVGKCFLFSGISWERKLPFFVGFQALTIELVIEARSCLKELPMPPPSMTGCYHAGANLRNQLLSLCRMSGIVLS